MRLLELRKSKKLTQQSLAEVLSVSQQSVDKYEKNINEPDIQLLEKIAAYFDVSVDYLIGYSDNPHALSTMTMNGLTKEEEKLMLLIRKLPKEA